MHVHISALNALIVAAYVIVIGFIFRTVAAKYSDTPFGQALAYVW